MIIGFVIWSIVAVTFLVIGISSWSSENEVGFFTWVKPPKMKDVTAYNHAVGKIWFWFTGLFEMAGIPFLFIEQNSPIALLVAAAVVLLIIGLIIAYLRVEAKYRIDSHSGGAQP